MQRLKITDKKIPSILIVVTLFTTVAVLGFIFNNGFRKPSGTDLGNGAIESANAESLTSSSDPSQEAKASLFYPTMKTRGPLKGGKLTAKPLEPNRAVTP